MGQEIGRRPKLDAEPRGPEAVPDEHEAFNAVVGEAIRKARREHSWTQAFLAKQARLSPNYIARLGRGELGPSPFVASRICGALGIELEILLGAPAGGVAPRKTPRRRAAG